MTWSRWNVIPGPAGDHPPGDEAAADFPTLEAMAVTRCGIRPMGGA